MLNKAAKSYAVPDTDSGLRPGDFPVGSLESRAAARSMLRRIQENPGAVLRVRIVHIGCGANMPLRATTRSQWDGGLTEIVHAWDGQS